MPHIHTKPGQHDATTSAFIVRTDTEQPTVLFHMHKKIHKLLQPGGHIELDETPWQAILHEVCEETGYDLQQLTIMQPAARLTKLSGGVLHPVALCHNTHAFSKEQPDHFHTDTSYLFVATAGPTGLPRAGESTDLRWLSREQLVALTAADAVLASRDIALYALDSALDEWDAVSIDQFVT